MISSPENPRIYVIAKSKLAQEMISKELCDEAMELVQLTDEQQYFETLDSIQSGCVLVEVSGNPEEELRMIASIRSRQQRMQVIAFSDDLQVSTAVQAMKRGAIDVCGVPSVGVGLKLAIHNAIAMDRKSPHDLPRAIPNSVLEKLSAPEVRILRLIVDGLASKEIAASMDVSVRTFHYRKQAILTKLSAKNRSEVIEVIRLASECESGG